MIGAFCGDTLNHHFRVTHRRFRHYNLPNQVNKKDGSRGSVLMGCPFRKRSNTHFSSKETSRNKRFLWRKNMFSGAKIAFFVLGRLKTTTNTQRSSLNQSDRKPLSRPTSMTSPKAVKDLLMDCAWCVASPKQVLR